MLRDADNHQARPNSKAAENRGLASRSQKISLWVACMSFIKRFAGLVAPI